MGRAIVTGLLEGDVLRLEQVVGTIPSLDEATLAADALGIRVICDNVAAVQQSDVVVLAVKPQVAGQVLTDPDLQQAMRGKLLISIAAGIRLEQLDAWLPETALIRAMPNTPCTIREGMTVLAPGPRVEPHHLDAARDIFSSVGRCRVLREKYLDAVTALGGSGPAFACVLLESMADGGVMMGLPRDVAIEIAAQSMQGAARLVLQTGAHPAALKDAVTTPAGCTIAGLLTMEDGRIRSTMARAIQEATQVAGGLGQGRSSDG
jgi:pyrroline-5-carboxylate reductase